MFQLEKAYFSIEKSMRDVRAIMATTKQYLKCRQWRCDNDGSDSNGGSDCAGAYAN